MVRWRRLRQPGITQAWWHAIATLRRIAGGTVNVGRVRALVSRSPTWIASHSATAVALRGREGLGATDAARGGALAGSAGGHRVQR